MKMRLWMIFHKWRKNYKQQKRYPSRNFSKALLHFGIAKNGKSASIKRFLNEAFKQNENLSKIPYTNLVSDGGAENKGEVNDWVKTLHPQIKRLFAYTDAFPYSNNCVESINNTFKNEFLRDMVPKNTLHLLELLKQFYHYYNYERFPTELYGYNPIEVLQGAVPDKHRFKDKIAEAKKQRPEKNRKGRFCEVCA